MAETHSRIVAMKYGYDDKGMVATTTIYFGNGKPPLVAAGYWNFPHLVTLSIRHKKNGTDPDTITGIDLLSG